MKICDPGVPSILRIADRIVADIRRRRLKPGDAYLTTAETARFLGVSTTMANRAMQLLVQRQLLDRRQRKGTTVATPVAGARPACLRRVHVLVNRRHVQTEGLLTDGRLIGIQSALPGADIGCHFVPEGGEPAEIDRLVRKILAAREAAGLVMLRASLEAQRALAASGLPAVLSGTPYPSIRGLPWVERDNCQVGRLMAGYLLNQQVRGIAVLMRERTTQGDHLVLDAVRDTMAEAGLPLRALTFRGLPADSAAAAAEIGVLLDAQPGPLGLLCRGTPLAEAARAAIATRSFPRGQRPVVAVCDLFGAAAQHAIYPHARPVLGPQEWGARIGKLLACQARGERPQPEHELIPVELVVPPQ
jgi:DNA-binding LacI/PurR family transcriptional regulator